MTTERLKILLSNAIVVLQDEGYLPDDIQVVLGMSDAEYNEITEPQQEV